ncbi:MAG: hypothetical protein WBD55_09855, partial [Dehalococcoidia bacterium]
MLPIESFVLLTVIGAALIPLAVAIALASPKGGNDCTHAHSAVATAEGSSITISTPKKCQATHTPTNTPYQKATKTPTNTPFQKPTKTPTPTNTP